ncbi:MAG: ribbon-helix-helix protein, CopG family [Acidobacteria bacterium]|nr:ribbon-helix-helix protein, CopG family [Acidobacteriota bacterium]
MYSTTLRLDDDLARFLQEEAKVRELSVNALLAQIIHQAKEARARKRLARDWAAYAQDDAAQDVSYALPAQIEAVAEAKPKPYRAPKKRP